MDVYALLYDKELGKLRFRLVPHQCNLTHTWRIKHHAALDAAAQRIRWERDMEQMGLDLFWIAMEWVEVMRDNGVHVSFLELHRDNNLFW